MNTLKFWIAFSVGVAAGATIALLCAPQSGDETRKQLRSKFEDASDSIKDAAEDLGAKASKVYSRGKDVAGDLGEQAAKAYGRGKDAAAEYSDDLTENLRSAAKSVRG